VTARDILAAERPRKLLAIDGGGIRGAVSIEVLDRIEQLARQAYGEPNLVLADCFDYIAGTSTGAIIAAGLAIGRPVAEIRDLYEHSGPLMFSPARLRDLLHFRYSDEPLARVLKEKLGADTTLGSDLVRTLLLIVLCDATTNSPWPVSNNPRARFNQADSPTCNLQFPLWQLVRASTAAPLFFPPEVITIGGCNHVFVDGSISPYSNPAFQLFLMSTLEAYRLCWPPGEDRMLLVSVGAGVVPHARPDLSPHDMNLLYQATTVPQELLAGSIVEQDLLCRVFGQCRHGALIDSEVGDLIASQGPVQPKLFSYVRYDMELSRRTLDREGLAHIDAQRLRHPDAVDAIPEFQEIGRALARSVKPEHFAGFFGLPQR
jgi:hypothetical protein